MTPGRVKVMGAGVVVIMSVKEVRMNMDTYAYCVNDIIMLHCILARCPSLTSPNGIYRCIRGSDIVLSFEDTCHLVCNTGYEPSGSNIRTCQSDGSWSGSDGVCRRGECVGTTLKMIL